MSGRLLKGPFTVDDYHRLAEVGILGSAAHQGPEDILLVIEVADTSLETDRTVKLPLYAAAGIPEGWLLDLVNDVIEVHRQPGPEGYREDQKLARGDTLAAFLVPTGPMSVDELLGPRV